MMERTVTSWQDARELFKKWRDENERRSEEVLELWISALGPNVSKLGDEKWMVLEQVATAALDLHNMPLADDTLLELKGRFPKSERVKLLQVCRLQALNRHDEALKGLDNMIARDPTNSAAYKRKISILKGQGRMVEAIKELADYLTKFMSDQEGWSELCDLYLGEGDYAKAVFCAEELILHTPHNFFVHQRLADIRYTMGGLDNLKLAVAYYSQAYTLNNASLRALCGLFLASSNLCSNPRLPAADKKELTKVVGWTAKEISKRYSGSSLLEEAKQVDMLENVFGNLQIQA
ncbi:ER membrane protein complex subunit 2-A [Folsomia candida]|uniref:ER membrane protein complex subunit 2 n=1 Tax=Folsomia candida TaxID=158441 RepID=A0A226DB76_FOLCA|nr:ER membrane protein complex subunit 2-A [Folsomia candida]XP_035715265.1 ER membrane protein complex subunit 2-A [Folsomia candida]OXA42795.1 ER membrane protein complex subunit 2-A [Folsomia candida]